MNQELGIKGLNGIKAVIFDLDGLLMDTEPAWHAAYWGLCRRHGGIPEDDIEKYTLGMGLKECIDVYKTRNGMQGDNKEELIKEYREILYDLLLSKGLNLMEGGRELLENLDGQKVALATGGHAREGALKLLEKTKADKFFDVVISGDQVEKGKPNPDIFLETAKELGVEASKCLVLEDAPNGVMAAKAAGMTAYGVNKDEKIREDLRKAGADRVFKSLGEILL